MSPLAARPEECPPPAVRTKPDSEPTIAASALVADKQATVTEGLVLTMRGTVFLPNGSVAEDAVLEQSPEYDGSDVVSATIIEGQFEIRTTGTRINPPGILIRSPDWKLQASLNMGSHTLRSECAAPKRVTLVPAKVIQVKVTDGQTAVAGSHVQVEAGSYKYLAITRSDGVAELKMAHDETVFLISAWTDDHRIGGLHAARKPTKDQYGTDFHIEISRGAPLRVRVVDSRRQPVANVPLRFAAATGAHGEMFVGANPTSGQTTAQTAKRSSPGYPTGPRTGSSSVSLKTVLAAKESWKANASVGWSTAIEVSPSRTNERVAITGQLSGFTTDVSGLLVEFWSHQGEEEHRADVLYVCCDANGQFRVRVLPGSQYSVFVNDCELVSRIWDGVVVLSTSATVRRPEPALTKGVPVEVHVTKGAISNRCGTPGSTSKHRTIASSVEDSGARQMKVAGLLHPWPPVSSRFESLKEIGIWKRPSRSSRESPPRSTFIDSMRTSKRSPGSSSCLIEWLQILAIRP